MMMDEAEQLKQLLTSSDPLLHRLWPLILQDRGLDGETSEDSALFSRVRVSEPTHPPAGDQQGRGPNNRRVQVGPNTRY